MFFPFRSAPPSRFRSRRYGWMFLGVGLVTASLTAASLLAADNPPPSAPKAPPPKEAPAKESSPAAKIDFAKDIGPLIKKYCYECHTGDEPEAEFSLYFQKESDFKKRVELEREHFEKMINALTHLEMPPMDAPQPSAAERARLIAWLDRDLLAAEAP